MQIYKNKQIIDFTELPEWNDSLGKLCSISESDYYKVKNVADQCLIIYKKIKNLQTLPVNVQFDSKVNNLTENLFINKLIKVKYNIEDNINTTIEGIKSLRLDKLQLNIIDYYKQIIDFKNQYSDEIFEMISYILYSLDGSGYDKYIEEELNDFLINKAKNIQIDMIKNRIGDYYSKFRNNEVYVKVLEFFSNLKNTESPVEELIKTYPQFKKLYRLKELGYIEGDINSTIKYVIENDKIYSSVPEAGINTKDSDSDIIFKNIYEKIVSHLDRSYAKFLSENQGKFSLQEVINKYVKNVETQTEKFNIDINFIRKACELFINSKKSLKLCLEKMAPFKNQISDVIVLLYGAGKLNINNFSNIINNLENFLPGAKLYSRDLDFLDTNEKLFLIGKYLLKNINNPESAVDKFIQLENFIHNNFHDIKKDEFIEILENPNIININVDLIKDLFNIYMFSKNIDSFAIEIDKAIDDKFINKDFYQNLEKCKHAFINKALINPSSQSGKQLNDIIKKTQIDIEFIQNYREFSEHFKQAKQNKKNPQLFKLDFEINPNLRVRVLKDLDFDHFTVGKQTDCCQRLGGAGESAAIDSFVNPLAGVLVLEYLNNDNWDLVAQSYFHYVPKDNGIILDNVESSTKYKNGINGIKLEDIYAYWAKHFSEQFKYIQSGLGYSKIQPELFDSIIMEDDPREFSVDEPYSDWDSDDKNIDLTKYKKQIPDLKNMISQSENNSIRLFKSAMRLLKYVKMI